LWPNWKYIKNYPTALITIYSKDEHMKRKGYHMQTPAEKYLIQKLASFLTLHGADMKIHRILNAGAGSSISIEQQLTKVGCSYICDRIDIENCNVDLSAVGECWQCSIDDMKPICSGRYIAVFTNYVLEHVENIRGTSQEIYRVLAPGGLFIATVPNTLAFEFVLAKHTPLWFHKLVRGGHGWETKYAYNRITELIDVFLDHGFRLEEEKRWPYLYGYLWKYPILNRLGLLYDKTITLSKHKRLMGNVCLSFQKPT
jgi:SAM-dependent methyltransferase